MQYTRYNHAGKQTHIHEDSDKCFLTALIYNKYSLSNKMLAIFILTKYSSDTSLIIIDQFSYQYSL